MVGFFQSRIYSGAFARRDANRRMRGRAEQRSTESDAIDEVSAVV